jgi:hypothetical protein
MKQIEATPDRPFFSVGYQYARNPSTVYSFNSYFEVTGDKRRATMSGTDDAALAKRCADYCVTQPGVKFAWVHKTEDCYNHKEVYKTERQNEFNATT